MPGYQLLAALTLGIPRSTRHSGTLEALSQAVRVERGKALAGCVSTLR